MTYANRAERAKALAEAAPVTPMDVLSARALMRRGHDLKSASALIGITPSSRLDLAIWNHLGTPDEDLIAAKPKRRKRYQPDF